jgi:hypothetical protein
MRFTTNLYRVPAADTSPQVTLNLDSIESIEYSTGADQKGTLTMQSGDNYTFPRQVCEGIETAWQAWHQQHLEKTVAA